MDARVVATFHQDPYLSAHLQAFAASSPLPTAALEGAEHIICYANPAFCLLIGKSHQELIGKPFCSAAPAPDECRPLLDRVNETGQAEIYTQGRKTLSPIRCTGLTPCGRFAPRMAALSPSCFRF
jgi:PAS domain-containing protein